MENKEIKVEQTENKKSENVEIQESNTKEVVEQTNTVDAEAESEIEIKETKVDEVLEQSKKEKEDEIISEKKDNKPEIEEINWIELTKDKIVEKVKDLVNNYPVMKIKSFIDTAKIEFYKKHNEEINKLKTSFIESGENEEDFIPMPDKIEEEFKQYISIYKGKKQEFVIALEKQKQENIVLKEEIIQKIKDLVNSTETMNTSFIEFKTLQEMFNNIGDVPFKESKNIWNSYHSAVELFYDYVKINRELRDLDLKKNLKAKLELIEKTKELIKSENILDAHKSLQILHDKWREIGPVPREQREELWKEFSDNSRILNKKHQDYFEALKAEKIENLKLKETLCEKVEEISEIVYDKLTEWNKKTEEITKIQQEWKEIGFTPKNTNNKIYKRFRDACNVFFDNRKEFFGSIKNEQQTNLQRKYELCEKAEALQNSEDWKNTTEKLIQLQKQWKKIGPVPRKKSDFVWNRFRSACDIFFNNKDKAFAGQKEQELENLKLKEELLVQIEKFEHLDNIDETLAKLKEFQNKWSEIGFVPIKSKNDIQNKFRSFVNKHFDNLKVDVKKRDELRFTSKLEDLLESNNPKEKFSFEKDKILKKIAQLQNDAVLLENNMGFFSNSKGAEALLGNVKKQIEDLNNSITLQKSKLKLINQFMNKISK